MKSRIYFNEMEYFRHKTHLDTKVFTIDSKAEDSNIDDAGLMKIIILNLILSPNNIYSC